MPRYSINLSDEDAAKLKDMAQSDDRTMASMLRCIVKSALRVGHVGISTSEQRQSSAKVAPKRRQTSAKTAPIQQSPTPARARVPITSERRREEEKEKEAPQVDIIAFTSHLTQRVNELAGTNFHPHDPNAQRAVVDRLRPQSPHQGAPATPEQVEAMVSYYARTWAGTKFAGGLALSALLDDRFWTRHGAMDAEAQGQQAKSRNEAAEKRRREERARQAKERFDCEVDRRADEHRRRMRTEQTAPLSPSLQRILDNVGASLNVAGSKEGNDDRS